MISWARILIDGMVLSFVLGAILLLILRINPRLMLQDYPEDIKAGVPPKTPEERRKALPLAIPFFAALVGIPLHSTWLLKQQNGGQITLWAAFTNTYGVFMLFNLFDLVVLNWLMFCTLTPKFVVIPGSEGMAGYKDYAMHFRGFLIGCLLGIIPGAIVALVVMHLL